jgi:hypothetical protein
VEPVVRPLPPRPRTQIEQEPHSSRHSHWVQSPQLLGPPLKDEPPMCGRLTGPMPAGFPVPRFGAGRAAVPGEAVRRCRRRGGARSVIVPRRHLRPGSGSELPPQRTAAARR